MYILWLILGLIIVIGLAFIFPFIVYGQETDVAPPPVQQPTPVNTPTPTSPNPNLQYLPQKAYVQSFAPENGVPSSVPLQAVPQVVPASQQSSFDLGSIMGVLGALGAGAAYMKGHLVGNKNKETMAGTLNTKEAVEQLARTLFNMNPEKANQITDAPAIKLETLSKDKEEFADKTAKA